MVINDAQSFHKEASSFGHQPKTDKQFAQVPIAVVGLACRLPGHSTTPKKLWELLERGGIAANEAPESRFNLKAHHDGSKKPKTMRSPGGMFIEDIDPRDFDAAFFGISSADAAAMDPQQRQLLEVVYECLENSGVPLEKLNGANIGCHVGSYAVDYGDMQARNPEDRAPGAVVGIGRAMLSNRISHFFNFKGPSMTIDTACSGSLVGLDVACRYLHTGEVDGAIIAGANMYFSPEHNLNTGAMKDASSLSGKCHTFDIKADGYIKAEAVNSVFIKRLSDAVRDGDPIRAIIRGSATNSDGRTPGIASPSAEAQALAIRAAYANAGITDLNATSYLEFHGTGTQAGDPEEVRGVSSVFTPSRNPEAPLIIGSIKSNIGHSEPAAGISGLLKAILAIENGMIPGNPTFITPNPKIDFENLRVRATQTKIRWPNVPFKRASVNSFGYGGSNAHVIVEEPLVLLPDWSSNHVSSFQGDIDLFGDDETVTGGTSRPSLLVLSANDESSLRAYSKALNKHLTNPNVKVALSDLSYTLSTRRTHHFNRGYLITGTASIDESSLVVGKKALNTPRVGFVFTGQGAQWSQMGKAITDAFPQAKEIIQELDEVLQRSAAPPSWSLLEELTQPREGNHLRQPEFSQPLVTALQIALVNILRDWGVHPCGVAGHSSGEIAAAYTAGLLSKEDAIRAAYYRGQASARAAPRVPVGMMAVGVGAKRVAPYLEGLEDTVQIACYNSPSSLTLSGAVDALNKVKARLASDEKFARMLQVDLAYHSTFMEEISKGYTQLLAKDFDNHSFDSRSVRMFSSVTGEELTGPTDAEYWKNNMVRPVRFDAALEKMVTVEGAPDFLIEIGPSGALAGPASQVLKNLGLDTVQYCSAMARGDGAIRAVFDVAGKLFIAGGNVNLDLVNRAEGTKPKVLIDLPNYSWNHSTKYWYESEASRDWRERLFPHHDLLGSKVLGSSWHAPAFTKAVKVEDLPWLADHKMGPDIVFPAAGFMAMAIEAVFQKAEALTIREGATKIKNPRYRLRNVEFKKALVLNVAGGQPTQVNLSLSTYAGAGSWHAFEVSSLQESTWAEHCCGLVRIEEDVQEDARLEDLQPLQHPVDAKVWHTAMVDAGYNFGPSFQKGLQIETLPDTRSSRSTLSLLPPGGPYLQSTYPMHPAAMDGCFQTCAPSLWKGHRNAVNAVLVPAIIDNLTIVSSQAASGLSLTSARYIGLGRPDFAKNYLSDARVYDPETGRLLLQLAGLRYHRIDTGPSVYDAHTFTALSWKPDVSLLSTAGLAKIVQGGENSGDASISAVSQITTLAAFKKPNQRVLELNTVPGESESVWLASIANQNLLDKTYRNYSYRLSDPNSLIEASQKYETDKNDVALLHLDQDAVADGQFDLVIVRLQPAATGVGQLSRYIRQVIAEGGHVLFLRQRSLPSPGDLVEATVVNGDAQSFDDGASGDLLRAEGLTVAGHVTFAESSAFASLSLSSLGTEHEINGQEIELYRFSDASPVALEVVSALQARGWTIQKYGSEESSSAKRVLVLDELETSLFPTMSAKQWDALRALLTAGKRVLWVTKGSSLGVDDPDKAMIHGLGRTVRAEDPSVSLTTLDVSGTSIDSTAEAVNSLLQQLGLPEATHNVEREFVEREGVIHISRLQPDDAVNEQATESFLGAAPVTQSLQDSPNMIRLRCERVGATDSLTYSEVAPYELPLKDNMVEVEVYAAGLNFKDVAITMGIVPDNEHILGLEGGGKIRRLGRDVKNLEVGQRVLVFKKGSFCNRVHAEAERVHPIPDSMSFEETSTLASGYLTALYSIHDLANTQRGHKVLIHSATGGLGLAAIQICQHIGAEVFATVGNQKKREFLMKEYNISADHIFHSRDISFASDLMRVTGGYGVDVVLNSLVGDLLDESWRCIAAGGTMVELGKRDMLDRKTLSMEPFGRNASYRCFDMSHDIVSDQMIHRLLKQLFALLDEGHVRPVTPITVFPWEDIAGAMRYMRSANHLGKIVISSGEKPVHVPVRPARAQLTLRHDVAYMLVGGLKGLCGSVAVYMAELGAKHLVIMARSGYKDDVSQRIIADLHTLGCELTLAQGDVSVKEDVRRAIKQASLPIGGVIQGAMVLRDRVFTSMTIEDYHTTISCKVPGTWNLHNVLLEENMTVDFFTMLSSVSGVVGQKGQANYAAANVFLDAFAAYRHRLGLRANSVDLGAISNVGYMSHHEDLLTGLSSDAWTPINEALMLKIVGFSLRQQLTPISSLSASQLVTSISVPQREDSSLSRDARFGGLCFGDGGDVGHGTANDGSKEIQALLLLVKNKASISAINQATVDVAVRQFTAMLRLSEPMEPAKSLGSYGLDSLAAVEFRNWVRMELKVDVTVLEITSASSLIALCDKIATRLTS
ncbi:putative polyketide synthase [Dactylonectria estremocensis]|uniref:Polyketide synthase n=1 Tax=Dactylonectria estremocensis TaxID=1079267 RepID=A0A9P9ENW0_9HYPO|nr:putative polyketide synthase [Dactylonectria estremocensis]